MSRSITQDFFSQNVLKIFLIYLFKKISDANTNMDFHRFDEQVSLQLELKDDTDSKKNLALKRRFLRCSSIATVTHLKKFIAKKLLTSVDKHKDIEIYCNDEALFKDHTLKFVYVTKWRTKEAPIVLKYCATPGTEVEG